MSTQKVWTFQVKRPACEKSVYGTFGKLGLFRMAGRERKGEVGARNDED